MTAAETMRAWWAIQLSPNVDVCCSLLRDEPLDAEALDQLALSGARHNRRIGEHSRGVIAGFRARVEVVSIHCAAANPVQAVVARDGDQGAVLGVMDGSRPLGVEDDAQARARRDFVRKIGYKLS